jgi:tripeptide aminopeptidase
MCFFLRLAAGALLMASSAFAVGDPAVLINDPAVKAALAAAQRNEPWTLDEQVRITEIPAPPFNEGARAKEFERLFRELGLKDVRIDAEGNVIGVRPGERPTPNVVISAHLDTVFAPEVNVKVRREGTRLTGPGITDNGRGLAAMLSVIRALDEGGVRTPGTLTFVATVGEEGLGDLRGVKAIFASTLKDQVDAFIAIDVPSGDGAGPNRFTVTGVGSYRYKVTFKGTGGHSYGAFGLANPIHALGRAVAKIGEIRVPAQPRTTFNVGRIGGGTSVNSIAFEAWMEVDMRSESMPALDAVKTQVLAAVDAAVTEESARWNGRGNLSVDVQSIGVRPAGSTALDSPLVRSAMGTITALGLQPITNASSTDSNVPMALGIPAITIGGGGVGTGAHTLEETYDSTDSHLGPQVAILLAVSMAR